MIAETDALIPSCNVSGESDKMADDFDVEALLEAPYKKQVNGEVRLSHKQSCSKFFYGLFD